MILINEKIIYLYGQQSIRHKKENRLNGLKLWFILLKSK